MSSHEFFSIFKWIVSLGLYVVKFKAIWVWGQIFIQFWVFDAKKKETSNFLKRTFTTHQVWKIYNKLNFQLIITHIMQFSFPL